MDASSRPAMARRPPKRRVQRCRTAKYLAHSLSRTEVAPVRCRCSSRSLPGHRARFDASLPVKLRCLLEELPALWIALQESREQCQPVRRQGIGMLARIEAVHEGLGRVSDGVFPVALNERAAGRRRGLLNSPKAQDKTVWRWNVIGPELPGHEFFHPLARSVFDPALHFLGRKRFSLLATLGRSVRIRTAVRIAGASDRHSISRLLSRRRQPGS